MVRNERARLNARAIDKGDCRSGAFSLFFFSTQNRREKKAFFCVFFVVYLSHGVFHPRRSLSIFLNKSVLGRRFLKFTNGGTSEKSVVHS